jgi:tRNA A22 N-methylase
MKNIENTEFVITREDYFDGTITQFYSLIEEVFKQKSIITFKFKNINFQIKDRELIADGKIYEILNAEEAEQLIEILTSNLYPKFSYMLNLDKYTIQDVYTFIQKNE